jgi:hypothetical protein
MVVKPGGSDTLSDDSRALLMNWTPPGPTISNVALVSW